MGILVVLCGVHVGVTEFYHIPSSSLRSNILVNKPRRPRLYSLEKVESTDAVSRPGYYSKDFRPCGIPLNPVEQMIVVSWSEEVC